MKITANRSVRWKAGSRTLSGKVKQVIGDHLVVSTSDGTYIVRTARVTLVPFKPRSNRSKSK